MFKGLIFVSISLLVLGPCSFLIVSALNYGTTCSGAVDLSSTAGVGVGAGFRGFIDSPFDKSWYNSKLSTPVCSNSLNTLIASQQWVWYSVNAGTGSYLSISTVAERGIDTGSANTILLLTSNICSSSSSPSYCNDDYSSAAGKKSEISTSSSISGTYQIAIGQYATSSANAITYSVGKAVIWQFCVSSCSACSALPAKLFYPNAATEYTYKVGTSLTSTCGTIYNKIYYAFIAPSAGSVLISTCTSDGADKTHSLTTRIAVYLSCSVDAIQCVTGNSSCSNSARVTFNVTQGTTYTVAIGSTSSSTYDGIGLPVFRFTCAAGTYDDDNNQNTACAPCAPIANCITVTCTNSTNSICTSCISGFYSNNGSCSACSKPNCVNVTCTSSSNSVCTSCQSGAYLSSGSCPTCLAKANCAAVTCTTGSSSTCTVCNSGYYLSGSNCFVCSTISHCAAVKCTSSSSSTCAVCNSGYYLSSGYCYACDSISNCANVTCSTYYNEICTVCDSGSYLNSGGSCPSCTPKTNCTSVTCSSASNSVCTSCRTGSYLSNGSCLTCSAKPNCNRVACSNSSVSVCTACRNGYYLNNSVCVACTPVDHCTSAVTCSTSSKSVCTSCESEYLVSGGSCVLSCGNDTYLSGDGSACLDCTPIPNCNSVLTCTTSNNSVCTSCDGGTYLNNGTCRSCMPKINCASVACSNDTSSTCTSCQSSFYLESDSCLPCLALLNCAAVNCINDTISTCTSCYDGYYLYNDSCSPCTTVSNCNSALTCTTSSNSICTSCTSGFFVDNGSCADCAAVDNCNSVPICSNSSNSVCFSCNSGYYLNKGACVSCTAVVNCNGPITCSTSSNSVCTSCNNGYYLSNGSCTACSPIPNCNSDLTCSTSSNSVCTSCDIGHYLNGSNLCLDCLEKSNCMSASCSNGTVSACIICSSGYTLKNGDCIFDTSNNNNNNNESASSSPLAAIGGAVGGVLVLVLLVVLIVVLKKRRLHPRSNVKFEAKESQSSEYLGKGIPLNNVSVSRNLNSTSISANNASQLYDAPLISQSKGRSSAVTKNGTQIQYANVHFESKTNNNNSSSSSSGAYETPAPIIPPRPASLAINQQNTKLGENSRASFPLVPVYDTATSYSKLVLSYSFIKKEILIDKVIGDGAFGVVKLGRIHNSCVPPYCKDLISKDSENNFLPCAVKTLRESSDEKSQRDFVAECKMMANFYHPNVIRVIAVLLTESPPILVIEYMKYGDLKGILNKSESKSLFWHNKEFLFVLQQIARGMEYLQSIKFIHRDLAARNCLVSDNLTIKISDFGLSKELAGEKDYYKLQTKGRLPVKWMAPESIGFRRFTHSSDVWSFGITMWEVFSYAHTPYGDLRGSDVLALIEKGERLECPSPCFSIPVVYEWMLKCWEHDPNNRPSFSECVKFLSSQMNSPAVFVQAVRNIGEML